jgi:SAM-dependent methyltransferase
LLLVGAGTGDTCCGLAERSGRVTALCFSEEQARNVKQRGRAAELDNLQLHTHTPGERFDLGDETIDAVIIERLMNYPASYAGRTSPEQAALQLLKEAQRVLVPGGVLVIGAQNLLHHALGLGRAIDSLRKSTPRTDAGLDADLAALGSDRRTFRQTLNGYRQLIQAAGFDVVRAFAPLPDGVNPHAVISLDDPGPQQFLFRQRTRRHSMQTRVAATLGEFAAITGLLPRVTPFYYLVASR